MDEDEFIEARRCPHCGGWTSHWCFDHERDSTSDTAKCRRCGARWSGLINAYGPPSWETDGSIPVEGHP